jgi:glucose-6-phosphate isomerase
MENVDPTTLAGLMDVIDFKRTMFNVITKSGGTIETMGNFMVLKKKLIEVVGAGNYKKHIVMTTDPAKGELRKIVNEEGYSSFDIPSEVGGRFSVLSAVGLLSAAVSGVNIKELLEGARWMDETSKNKDIWKNPACMSAVLQYIYFGKGRNISVLMPYSDRLMGFAEWYCQLWAESLGKNEKTGSTPVRTLGVIDQHSQLQLYNAGPNDKTITFIKVKDCGVTLEIPKDFEKYESIGYLCGHTINELLSYEQKATELALTKNGRPNCSITIDKVSPFTVGALFYMFEMQTAFAGELFKINAFDQPGVEEGKLITSALLGRAGYEGKLKEINELPAVKEKFVI